LAYDLTAILSHKPTISNDQSKYTAVVKKKMDGEIEKQWMTFSKDKWNRITEVDARVKYPAQVLIYSLLKY